MQRHVFSARRTILVIRTSLNMPPRDRLALAFLLLGCGFSYSAEIQQYYHSAENETFKNSHSISGELLINQIALLDLLTQISDKNLTAISSCPKDEVEDGSLVNVELLTSEIGNLKTSLQKSFEVILERVLGNVTDAVRNLEEELGSAIAGVENRLDHLDPLVPQTSGEGLSTSAHALNGETFTCNGTQNIFASWGYITLNTGSLYDNWVVCTWNIMAPEGATINLLWEHIDLEQCDNCSCDYVEVRDEGHSNGRRYCGTLKPPLSHHKVNSVEIKLRTDSTIVKSGFKLQFIVA